MNAGEKSEDGGVGNDVRKADGLEVITHVTNDFDGGNARFHRVCRIQNNISQNIEQIVPHVDRKFDAGNGGNGRSSGIADGKRSIRKCIE